MKQRLLIALSAIFLAPSTAFCQWHPLGAGPNPCHANNIYELAVDDKQNVYASGIFNDSTTPATPDYYVAKWDGAKWSRFAPFKVANHLYAHNANVYTTVITDSANNYTNVLRWNGVKLDTIKGLNMRGDYFTAILETKSGSLLAAGTYDDSFEQHDAVMKWDGTQWDTLSKGASRSLLTGGTIYTMVEDNLGNIYVAGRIVDTSTRPYFSPIVMKWDGTTWTKVGTGSNSMYGMINVFALTCDKQNNIYAAGEFSSSLGNYVAKWDGTNWSELGQGAPALNEASSIYCLVTDSKDNLYACGWIYWQSTSGGGGFYVAKWNGQTWSIFGAQLFNEELYSLVIDQYDNLYTTGYFTNGYGNYYVDKYGYNSAGIQPQNEARFNLYPNPVKDYFTINTGANVVSRLQVTDVSGRVIHEEQLSGTGITQIDFRTAPAGLYFARITDNSGRNYVQKLTKQ